MFMLQYSTLRQHRSTKTQGEQRSKIQASTMSLQEMPLSQQEDSIQMGIFENGKITLVADTANVSMDNDVSLVGAPSQRGSISEQHAFKLIDAYKELDALAKSLSLPQEVGDHAKLRYSQVFNFSDLEGHSFQHDVLVAACLYIACREKDQQRPIQEIFKSTNATDEQMLSADLTLTAFFKTRPKHHRLPSNSNKRMKSAYKDLISSSESASIPQHATDIARYLYKKVLASGSFDNQDQQLIMLLCIVATCRHMDIPRTCLDIYTTFPDADRAYGQRKLNILDEFFTATMKGMATEPQNGVATATNPDAQPADQVILTRKELLEQLPFNECAVSTDQHDTVAQASFTPTAPNPASIATTADDVDTEIRTSTAPDAPVSTNTAHAFHDCAGDNSNVISTLPTFLPTATRASRKNARVMQVPLYNVICCRCGSILNLQNIHYAFQCLNCRHMRCNSCPMRPI